MKLTGLRIRDYRSVFTDDTGADFSLDLGDGTNVLVGRNNCGKSNVLRAVALALDPHAPFDPAIDVPGPKQFAYPVITLSFDAGGGSTEETALLDAARAYEQRLTPGVPTFADEGKVVLEVQFPPVEQGGQRRFEALLTPSRARPVSPDQRDLLDTALAALRQTVRFVLISSGESIQSVLDGNFREILHSVIREHLSDHFEHAEQARQEYIHGLQDELLAPLRDRLASIVVGLFPEIDGVTLSPEVSGIEATLSHVAVNLRDAVDTPLLLKGTGVRGGVLVAMLRYLADNATRGMVFALEEPEAFLHPAAQEDLRDNLEELADRDDVTLLVTTHSPFVISRSPHGRVFSLGKDTHGRTRVSAWARGDESHAPLVGELFRELTFAELLARATELPKGAKAVLLVEGDGDRLYLDLVARRAGRPELMADIHVQAAGGTRHIVTQAIVARASLGETPVAVLLDNDEPGRLARKDLKDKFHFANKREIISYADVFPADPGNFAYEAEDLFPPEIIEEFVTEHGGSVVDGSKRRPDGRFHYDLNGASKELLGAHLERSLRFAHLDRWLELIRHIRKQLGLPEIEVGDAPVEDMPASTPGSVLVLADRDQYDRYLQRNAITAPLNLPVPGGVTHIGFYADAGVKPEIPALRVAYSGLRFDTETVAHLRVTDSANDARAADLVDSWLASGEVDEGAVHRLLLLSSPDAHDTLVLAQPVRNTLVMSSGRPKAWAVGHKIVPYAALAAEPATTEELDVLIERARSIEESR